MCNNKHMWYLKALRDSVTRKFIILFTLSYLAVAATGAGLHAGLNYMFSIDSKETISVDATEDLEVVADSDSDLSAFPLLFGNSHTVICFNGNEYPSLYTDTVGSIVQTSDGDLVWVDAYSYNLIQLNVDCQWRETPTLWTPLLFLRDSVSIPLSDVSGFLF